MVKVDNFDGFVKKAASKPVRLAARSSVDELRLSSGRPARFRR
jgi:hypothetical protein